MPAILRMRSLAVLPLVLVTVLFASMFVTTPSASAMSQSQRIGNALDVVRHQKGDPYRYGSAGPTAFDCSGLVYYSFRKAGFTNFPRTSSAQAAQMRRIKRSSMRKGDFLFFYNGSARASNVYHVGVFVGWDRNRRVIIHAPSTGSRVSKSKLWTDAWFPGTVRNR